MTSMVLLSVARGGADCCTEVAHEWVMIFGGYIVSLVRSPLQVAHGVHERRQHAAFIQDVRCKTQLWLSI